MSAIRNVVMDLGGVMLDWNPDLLLMPFEPEPLRRRQLRAKIFGPDWHQFDRGGLTELELVARLQICSGQTRERVFDIIRAARDSLVEKPETIKLVRALHQRGLGIYCLSNMPAPMYEHLRRRHTFWDVFAGVVVSGEIRLMKPEPQIYLHLLERFGLIAGESVFVDDMQINVEAAKAVGLHAIRFLNATQCEQELDALLETTTPS